jgi:coenzyme F420-0:L-glutamate ligase/coenzyme F420-1:gamma-L-glutamate ligase
MSKDEEKGLSILPVKGIGEVRPGTSLAMVIVEALRSAGDETKQVMTGDILVVTQKVVSKAEGRIVQLESEDPDAKRRIVERESVRVLRRRGDLLITETAHGFICANAGVDLSNMSEGTAALLPIDPDRSARRIRAAIRRSTGNDVGVIISDTFGRAWRHGVTDVAIGCAGIAPLLDLRGSVDALGRLLESTEICVADEIASAAELVMGKHRGIPAAIVRGVDPDWFRDGSISEEIVRPYRSDLFR